MGFLTEGRALSWEEAAEKAEYVREHGIEQLLAIYHKVKDRKNDSFKWGDEVEYILLSVDEEGQKTRLCLRGAELLHVLQEPERTDPRYASAAQLHLSLSALTSAQHCRDAVAAGVRLLHGGGHARPALHFQLSPVQARADQHEAAQRAGGGSAQGVRAFLAGPAAGR